VEIVKPIMLDPGSGRHLLSGGACFGLGCRYCVWNGLLVRSVMVGEGRF